MVAAIHNRRAVSLQTIPESQRRVIRLVGMIPAGHRESMTHFSAVETPGARCNLRDGSLVYDRSDAEIFG